MFNELPPHAAEMATFVVNTVLSLWQPQNDSDSEAHPEARRSKA
jgi:hypothetical protein